MSLQITKNMPTFICQIARYQYIYIIYIYIYKYKYIYIYKIEQKLLFSLLKVTQTVAFQLIINPLSKVFKTKSNIEKYKLVSSVSFVLYMNLLFWSTKKQILVSQISKKNGRLWGDCADIYPQQKIQNSKVCQQITDKKLPSFLKIIVWSVLCLHFID